MHLDRLAHNLRLLGELAGGRPLWPAIKANAYGHDAVLVGRELTRLGCDTLCVAHAEEALELLEAGVRARFVLLSAALPEQSASVVEHGLEPVVATREAAAALSREAERAGRRVAVHVAVDTGMGRIGVTPEEAEGFVAHCRALPGLHVRAVMSHFPRADEADKSFSQRQIEAFLRVRERTRAQGVEIHHLANSAALFDLPGSHLDAVRPGIAIYGLAPSREIANPRVAELQPVLEWLTRITVLKEVPAGTGLSYGHSHVTKEPALIATLPVGYGDGLSRRLSNRFALLVHGTRCPIVGTVTMDQTLLDVTSLRGRVAFGDEVVLLGGQGRESLGAWEWADALGTISYEIVTAIARRVPRLAVGVESRVQAPA